MSIKGQGHSLTLVKGHSDFKVECLACGLYTQVSDSGPLGPLVCDLNFDRWKNKMLDKSEHIIVFSRKLETHFAKAAYQSAPLILHMSTHVKYHCILLYFYQVKKH